MSGRIKQIFGNTFGESSKYLKSNKNDRNDDNDGEEKYSSSDEAKSRDKRFSISKSGRFKQTHKPREVLDANIFADDKMGNQDKSNIDLDQESKNKSFAEIEAWIENSFTFEGYKTIRRKSSLTSSSMTPTMTTKSTTKTTTVDNEGQLETAL